MWFHHALFSIKSLLRLTYPIEQIIQQPVYRPTIFRQALNHGGGVLKSYDRLEFLGDAILESIISEYLYEKFPEVSEGKLTQMRAKLVRRSALNLLGYRIGLGKLIQSEFLDFNSLTDENKRIFGDTLESIIGAVYLNTGYQGAKHFIIQVLFNRFVKLDELEKSIVNHKGVLHEIAQKHHFNVDYQLLDLNEEKCKVMLLINQQPVVWASSRTKKKAEQKAARKALKDKATLFRLGSSQKKIEEE